MYVPSLSISFLYCSVSISEILLYYFIWPYPPERSMFKLIAFSASGSGQGRLPLEVSVSLTILVHKKVLQTACLTLAATEPITNT